MSINTPFYLDCDTGIDDALALTYLLNHPGVDLRGIGTVSGNIDAATAARNTTAILRMLDRTETPVAVGEHDPLTGSYAGGAPEVHGANGIGDVEFPPGAATTTEPAPQMLIRLAREAASHGQALNVIAIGPLTNLARALELEPDLPRLIGQVTVMGGAVWAHGNITPNAEANIYNDAAAARLVTRAGFDLTLVPLDLTHDHCFDDTDAQHLLDSRSDLHNALGSMLVRYIDFYEGVLGVRRAPLHDPLAAAIAVAEVNPVETKTLPIDVLLQDGNLGRTIPTTRRDHPATRVILSAEASAAELIKARILRPTQELAA